MESITIIPSDKSTEKEKEKEEDKEKGTSSKPTRSFIDLWDDFAFPLHVFLPSNKDLHQEYVVGLLGLAKVSYWVAFENGYCIIVLSEVCLNYEN